MNRRRLLQVCLGLTAARFVSREADAADVVRQERPVAAFDRLIVHGVLHAQGWDHETSTADAQAMEAREVAILAGLGFASPYEPG